MTDANKSPKPGKWKFPLRMLLVICALVLGALLSVFWYLGSPRFADRVRREVVARIEEATGGHVEIGDLRWKLSKLELELKNVTIHGLESPNEIPYAHADRIYVRAKIGVLIRPKLGLRFLELDHPVAHLIVYPDGSTNQPAPKIKRGSSNIDNVFDLALNRGVVKDGLFLINDRPIPIDFAADQVEATLFFDKPARRYDGSVRISKIDTKLQSLRPLSAVAEAKFSFFPKSLLINSLTVATGRSRFEATGKVEDFAHPAWDIAYRASLDFRELGQIVRTPQFRGGMASANGRVVFRANDLNTTAKLSIKNFAWEDTAIRLHNANLNIDVALDRNRVNLPRITGNVMGSAVSGSGTIANWRSQPGSVTTSPTHSKTIRNEAPEQQGNIKLHVSGMPISEAAWALTEPDIPLDQLHLVGYAQGDVVLAWKKSIRSLAAKWDSAIAPPPNPRPQEVPVAGVVRGAYYVDGGVVEFGDGEVFTPATHVRASGFLSRKNANLKLLATTSNFSELKPIFLAQRKSEIPLELQGQASFNGVVTGSAAVPVIDGRLELKDFNYVELPPEQTGAQNHAHSRNVATSAPRTASLHRIHWDELSGSLRYSPKQVMLRGAELRRGAAHINFDVSADLQRGQLTGNLPFTLSFAMRDAQLSDVQQIVGYSYPVSGTLNASAEITGTPSNLHGSGRIDLSGVNFYGQPISHVSSAVAFANREAQFINIAVAQNQARVTGTAAYNFTTRAYQFNLRGSRFNLGKMVALRDSRLQTSGWMNFTASGSGTPEMPSVNADVAMTDLVINGEPVGDLVGQARTTGDVMRISARSSLRDSDFHLDGTVGMREDFPASATVRFSRLDLDGILRGFTKSKLTGHSAFAGVINAHGTLKHYRNTDLRGDLSELYIPVQGVEVRNQGQVRFDVSRQILSLQQLHLIAEGTDFEASGTAELTAERRMNMSAHGLVNLKVIQSIDPNYTSYGTLTMNVHAGGTIFDPRVDGEVQISNAGISYIELPNALSDINGTLVFNRDRLQIAKLTGKTGGGTVNLTGYLTYGNTIGFNVHVAAQEMRLRYPPGVSAVADANLRLTGTVQNSLLSGDVTITRFGLNPQFDFASYLRSSQTGDVVPLNSSLNNMRIDMHVTSTPGLQVQTSLARLSGNVDLRMRGTAARPAVLGRVDIIEGDISFNGTKYHLERGDVTFSNPTKIQPYLDIQANTRVRDYDINLGFQGTPDRLNTTYRSDPPLATADIIALLAFGRTREESAQQPVANQNFTETASNAILGQALNATVSNRVQKLFGVSRIKIDPQVGGAENNPSTARVTVEQQVANNLTVTYITDVARSNQQIISVEYNVSRAVSILAVRDQNGLVSFDVRIRQRRR